jgi:hypothetical protein
MTAFTEQQMRSVQKSRALFTLIAIGASALASRYFAHGADLAGAMSAFVAWLWAMSAVLASHRIGIMKRAVARDEVREPPKTHAEELAEAVEALRQRQWDAIAERAFRASRPASKPPVPALPPRAAWDVSMVLDSGAPWNEVCHYQDVTGRPDGIAAGVIRVAPCTVRRSALTPGKPVVVSWTVVTRAASHGDGIDLLKVAEPLLRGRLAGFAHAGGGTWRFRVEGGVLAEVPDGAAAGVVFIPCKAETGPVVIGSCAHPDAEPVDLVTGERVAWVCANPECGERLPVDWRSS